MSAELIEKLETLAEFYSAKGRVEDWQPYAYNPETVARAAAAALREAGERIARLEGALKKMSDYKPGITRQIVDQVWHGYDSMWPDRVPVRLDQVDDFAVLADLIAFDDLRKAARAALSPEGAT